MSDAIDFLESRPLVGFQMDGSHLNNVLLSILQEQAQYQRQVTQRLEGIEDELRELCQRQEELQRALGGVGPEVMRKVRQQLEELGRGVEQATRGVREAREVGEAAAQAAEGVGRVVGPLQEQQAQLQGDLEELAAGVAAGRRHTQEALRDIGREQAQQAAQVQDIAREVEKSGASDNWQKLRDMLEEFSERTDKNFRSVEESARAVDAELNRHRTDINGVQRDMGGLHDKMRQGLSNIAKDVDEKCQMILDMLRDHEKSSAEIEQHMVAAGEALARRQAVKQSRGNSGGRGSEQIGTRRNGW